MNLSKGCLQSSEHEDPGVEPKNVWMVGSPSIKPRIPSSDCTRDIVEGPSPPHILVFLQGTAAVAVYHNCAHELRFVIGVTGAKSVQGAGNGPGASFKTPRGEENRKADLTSRPAIQSILRA